MSDSAFHYPPDLLNLLIDTVPRLVRSKKDLMLFFKGAGVPETLTKDLQVRLAQDRNSLNKFDITRTVLTRLNEGGDSTLAPRREVLKRVVEFEDYSSCYPDKQLEAQGLVAKVRTLLNVKDSFTRINIERERERQKRLADQQERLAVQERRRQELDAIKADLYSLFADIDPHVRGKQLEGVLNRLFKYAGVLIRESFVLKGDRGEGIVEQIDGLVEIDGSLYLVEMKWWDKPLGVGEVSPHLVRLYSRALAGGIIISASGYADTAVAPCREALAQRVVVLCELKEIIMALEQEADIKAMLKRKIQAAAIDREPLFRTWSGEKVYP